MNHKAELLVWEVSTRTSPSHLMAASALLFILLLHNTQVLQSGRYYWSGEFKGHFACEHPVRLASESLSV